MTVPPEHPATAGRPIEDVSVGELMGNVSRDLSTLLRQELGLAKAELKVEDTKAGRGTGMLAGAGVAGWMVLFFLSIALRAGLSNVMDAGWSGLIVAVVWAAIAAVLYSVGRRQLRQVNPKPEQTAATLKHVPDELKGARSAAGNVTQRAQDAKSTVQLSNPTQLQPNPAGKQAARSATWGAWGARPPDIKRTTLRKCEALSRVVQSPWAILGSNQ